MRYLFLVAILAGGLPATEAATPTKSQIEWDAAQESKEVGERDKTLYALLGKNAGVSGLNGVVLRAGDKDTAIEPVLASPRTSSGWAPEVGMISSNFCDFVGSGAEVRTTDKNPRIFISYAGPYIRGNVFLVKLRLKKGGFRTIKLGKSSTQNYGRHTGSTIPHKKDLIEASLKEISQNVYEVVPSRPLSKGEFGVYSVIEGDSSVSLFRNSAVFGAGQHLPGTGLLYDFAID